MSMQLVDMARFWREVAAPAAAAALLAAGYVLAAWKWPALRTPIASLRMWRHARWWRDVIGFQASGKIYHPADVTIIRRPKQ